MVIKDYWVHVCQNVKNQCNFLTKGLIAKLDRWFLTQDLMNAMGIIYFQYWPQLKVTSISFSHM
jgi:hypothetical protein